MAPCLVGLGLLLTTPALKVHIAGEAGADAVKKNLRAKKVDSRILSRFGLGGIRGQTSQHTEDPEDWITASSDVFQQKYDKAVKKWEAGSYNAILRMVYGSRSDAQGVWDSLAGGA